MSAEKLPIMRRRVVAGLGALALVVGVPKAVESVKHDRLVNGLSNPIEQVTEKYSDHHNVVRDKVVISHSAFAQAVEVAKDGANINDLSHVIASQQSTHVEPGDTLYLPANQVDMKIINASNETYEDMLKHPDKYK